VPQSSVRNSPSIRSPKSPVQLVELREAELEDHVQHALYALGLDVEILHRGGETAEHVQPLDEVEVGRHAHVAAAGVGQQRIEPLEVEGISRVRRPKPIEGRPIGPRGASTTWPCSGVGPPPAAAPVVGRRGRKEHRPRPDPSPRGRTTSSGAQRHLVLPERQPRADGQTRSPGERFSREFTDHISAVNVTGGCRARVQRRERGKGEGRWSLQIGMTDHPVLRTFALFRMTND